MPCFIRVNQKLTKNPPAEYSDITLQSFLEKLRSQFGPVSIAPECYVVTLSKQIILLAKKLFYKHEEINNFLKAEKPHFNVVKCFLYHICCSSFNNIIISRSELNTNNSGFRRFLVNLYKNILVFVRLILQVEH